jgi:hypothetical protein
MMIVGDLVILANLGELKVYDVMPRDLEAEAGMKPRNVKLDLVDEKIYDESHLRLHETVSDQAGRFKGGSQGRGTFSRGSIGEKHSLLQEKEEDVIREIAEDISNIISKKNTSTYLAIPDMIFKRVMERISPAAKAKITKTLETDLMKTDKMDLVDLFR